MDDQNYLHRERLDPATRFSENGIWTFLAIVHLFRTSASTYNQGGSECSAMSYDT